MALSLFALVFLVLAGSFAFFHIKYARAIGKHLQMLKAAGEPVTLEEITREYKSIKARGEWSAGVFERSQLNDECGVAG